MSMFEIWNTRPIPSAADVAKAVAAQPKPEPETPVADLAPLIGLYYSEEFRAAKRRVRDHRIAGRPAHSTGFTFFGPPRSAS